MNETEHYDDEPPFVGRPIIFPVRVFLVVFKVLLSISCTFGNSSLLVILIRQPFRRNTGISHIIFLINLTTADLLASCNYQTILLADLIIGRSPLATIKQCIASKTAGGVLTTTSALSLIGISLNRFMNVYFSHAYHRTFTLRRIVAYAVGSWLLAIFLNIQGVLMSDGKFISYNITFHTCEVRVRNVFGRVRSMSITVIPLIVILLLNHFTYKLWKDRRQKLKESMKASFRARGEAQESLAGPSMVSFSLSNIDSSHVIPSSFTEQSLSECSSSIDPHASSPLRPSLAAKTLDPFEEAEEVELDAEYGMKSHSISEHSPEGRGHYWSDDVSLLEEDLDKTKSLLCMVTETDIDIETESILEEDASAKLGGKESKDKSDRPVGKQHAPNQTPQSTEGRSVESYQPSEKGGKVGVTPGNTIPPANTPPNPSTEKGGSLLQQIGKQTQPSRPEGRKQAGTDGTSVNSIPPDSSERKQVQEQQSGRKEVTGLAGPKTTAGKLGTSGAESGKKITLETPESGRHSQTRERDKEQIGSLGIAKGSKSGDRSKIKPKANASRKTNVKNPSLGRSMVTFSLGRPMATLSPSTPFFARPKLLSEHASVKSIKDHAAFARSLNVVSVLLAVSLLPYAVVVTLGDYFVFPVEISLFCSSLTYLSNALNWIVYGYMNPVYRKAYTKLVPECARSTVDSHDRRNSNTADSRSVEG